MAGPASDYHRGEMDIQEQVSTFNLVMGMTKWGSLILTAFLLFLVLWFCTPAGFVSGFVTGGIVLALGIVLLRSKPESAH
jgi:hypothetical protein